MTDIDKFFTPFYILNACFLIYYLNNIKNIILINT